jgi:hypothetical protein
MAPLSKSRWLNAGAVGGKTTMGMKSDMDGMPLCCHGRGLQPFGEFDRLIWRGRTADPRRRRHPPPGRSSLIGEGGMKESAGDAEGPGVELSAAIEALRSALVRAWWDGSNSRVRFRVAPVELTVQVGVTRTGSGAAGIKWHVLNLGGERSKEAATTQTLVLQLTPVLFDEHGVELAAAEQLISDHEPDPRAEPDGMGRPAPEPE